jgi:hypothetical protein
MHGLVITTLPGRRGLLASHFEHSWHTYLAEPLRCMHVTLGKFRSLTSLEKAMFAKVRHFIMPTFFGIALLVAILPAELWAGTATARFTIRLVIAPQCEAGAPPAVPSVRAAADIASRYLGLQADTLFIDHDVADTGYWLVHNRGEPVLRIVKCTGALSEPSPVRAVLSKQNAPD